jgi:hypothetical protein
MSQHYVVPHDAEWSPGAASSVRPSAVFLTTTWGYAQQLWLPKLVRHGLNSWCLTRLWCVITRVGDMEASGRTLKLPCLDLTWDVLYIAVHTCLLVGLMGTYLRCESAHVSLQRQACPA